MMWITYSTRGLCGLRTTRVVVMVAVVLKQQQVNK
jgi:hypothetical protein